MSKENDEIWEDRYQHAEDKFTRHPWRTVAGWFLVALIVVVILSVIGNALGILSIYWQAARAKSTVAPRVTQRVYQPDNAIRQVAFFHDTCTKVHVDYQAWQNNSQQLKTDEQAAKLATNQGEQQQAIQAISTDQTGVTGAENVLAADAQAYNSRSAQYTANPFKDAGLPYRINPPAGAALASWSPPDCG